MKRMLAAIAALIAEAAMPMIAVAQEQAVHAIVFVDVIPSDQAVGSALLANYVRRARRDAALSNVALIKQADIPNHFILEETFTSEAARQQFAQQAYVREFRSALIRISAARGTNGSARCSRRPGVSANRPPPAQPVRSTRMYAFLSTAEPCMKAKRDTLLLEQSFLRLVLSAEPIRSAERRSGLALRQPGSTSCRSSSPAPDLID